jgi:hypothetical protein
MDIGENGINGREKEERKPFFNLDVSVAVVVLMILELCK